MTPTAIQTGYLVLADLSGYTSFMATSELDHAQGILDNIVALLRRHLTPALNLAEVEGDAVFLYVPGHRLSRGETLLELVERSYAAFRDKQRTMMRNVTCPCQACQAVPTLDLKFVVHAGEYALLRPTGTAKPVGSAVNLAHRLLKNGVADDTGWRGYALFTEDALERMGIRPEVAYRRRECYDAFGEVPVVAIDLDPRYHELTAARSVTLPDSETHIRFTHRFNAPAAIVWEWLHEPAKRMQWNPKSDWSIRDRPGGRTNVGAHNHCSNSGTLEEILDWHPFDSYTVRYIRPPLKMLARVELTERGEQTEVCWRMCMEGTAPRTVRCAICRVIASKVLQVHQWLRNMDRLIEADRELAVSA
jgi:hypothetical protein